MTVTFSLSLLAEYFDKQEEKEEDIIHNKGK